MPGPLWDDENNNMHPTCVVNASGFLTGQDVAFIAQISTNDTLTPAESAELYRLWHVVLGLELP